MPALLASASSRPKREAVAAILMQSASSAVALGGDGFRPRRAHRRRRRLGLLALWSS
jgi:hypothetical protein